MRKCVLVRRSSSSLLSPSSFPTILRCVPRSPPAALTSDYTSLASFPPSIPPFVLALEFSFCVKRVCLCVPALLTCMQAGAPVPISTHVQDGAAVPGVHGQLSGGRAALFDRGGMHSDLCKQLKDTTIGISLEAGYNAK